MYLCCVWPPTSHEIVIKLCDIKSGAILERLVNSWHGCNSISWQKKFFQFAAASLTTSQSTLALRGGAGWFDWRGCFMGGHVVRARLLHISNIHGGMLWAQGPLKFPIAETYQCANEEIKLCLLGEEAMYIWEKSDSKSWSFQGIGKVRWV